MRFTADDLLTTQWHFATTKDVVYVVGGFDPSKFNETRVKLYRMRVAQYEPDSAFWMSLETFKRLVDENLLTPYPNEDTIREWRSKS